MLQGDLKKLLQEYLDMTYLIVQTVPLFILFLLFNITWQLQPSYLHTYLFIIHNMSTFLQEYIQIPHRICTLYYQELLAILYLLLGRIFETDFSITTYVCICRG